MGTCEPTSSCTAVGGGVAVGVDVDHLQPVAHPQVDRRAGVLGEGLHERAGDAPHVHLGEQRVTETDDGGAEMVAVDVVVIAQVTELRQGVGEPGNRRLGQPGAFGKLGVAEIALPGGEAGQDLQSARQGADEFAVLFQLLPPFFPFVAGLRHRLSPGMEPQVYKIIRRQLRNCQCKF